MTKSPEWAIARLQNEIELHSTGEPGQFEDDVLTVCRGYERACVLLAQARMANESPAAWEDWWGDVVEFLAFKHEEG